MKKSKYFFITFLWIILGCGNSLFLDQIFSFENEFNETDETNESNESHNLKLIHSLKDTLPYLEGKEVYQDIHYKNLQNLKIKNCQLLIFDRKGALRDQVNLQEDVPVRRIRTITKAGEEKSYWANGFQTSQATWYHPEMIDRDEVFHWLFMAAQFCKMTIPHSQSGVMLDALTPEKDLDLAAQVLFDKINLYRQSLHLPPWQKDDDLMKLAKQHAENMVARQTMDHHDFSQRAKWVHDHKGPKMVRENVAMNMFFPDPLSKVFEQWRDSPGHHQNMILSWTETKSGSAGIGISVGENGKWYYAQLFSLDL